jgi:hypothetical protein
MDSNQDRAVQAAFDGRLSAKEDQLRAALDYLLWYVGQLEMLVYSADDIDEHEAVAKARAALSK